MLYTFDKEYTFSITDAEIKRCEEFADASTNDYWKRNQTDSDRIKQQIVFGKLGELVAAKFLVRHLKQPVMEPDFRIYTRDTKSWDADFPYKSLGLGNKNFHVKAYAPSDKPESWAFQFKNKSGNGGTDKLFENFPEHKKDCVICVLVDVDNKKGYIRVLANWGDLHYLLRDPISYQLRGLKKFLYYEDLINLKNEEKDSEKSDSEA